MDRQTFLRTGLTPIDYAEVIVNHQHCPIDLTDFTPESDIVKLTYGHIFCHDCLLTRLETMRTCPYCRRELFDQSDSSADSDDETLVDENEDSEDETPIDEDENSEELNGFDHWSVGSSVSTLVDNFINNEAELDDSNEDGDEDEDEEDGDPPSRCSSRRVQRVNRYSYRLDEFVVPDQPEAVQGEEDAEHYGLEPMESPDDNTSDWDREYDGDHDEEMLDLE